MFKHLNNSIQQKNGFNGKVFFSFKNQVKKANFKSFKTVAFILHLNSNPSFTLVCC